MVKYKNGFSLVEILMALVVMAVIASIVIAVGGPALTKAKKGKAEALIAAMEVAASMYRVDLGNFPPDTYIYGSYVYSPGINTKVAGGSECLYFYLGNELTIDGETYGPYMSFREEDRDDPGYPAYEEVIDPWGMPYGYYSYDPAEGVLLTPYHNTRGVDIFSKGPNTSTGSGPDEGNEQDDINNWR